MVVEAVEAVEISIKLLAPTPHADLLYNIVTLEVLEDFLVVEDVEDVEEIRQIRIIHKYPLSLEDVLDVMQLLTPEEVVEVEVPVQQHKELEVLEVLVL